MLALQRSSAALHGQNTITFGAGTASLTVTGSHGIENVTATGGAISIDLTGTSGYNTVTLNAAHNATWGVDTVHLDMTGHDVVTGSNSTNWTDVLDLTAAHSANQPLDLETASGWTELTGHGTIDVGNNAPVEHVFSDPAHTHNVVDFTHIDKLIY